MNRTIRHRASGTIPALAGLVAMLALLLGTTFPVVAEAKRPNGASPPRTHTSSANANGASGSTSLGRMQEVVDQIHARPLWLAGITGSGVDVAVIDTGVAPVRALSGEGKVTTVVDLSFEADVPEARHLDTYGHGTHIAGIIAGRDPGMDPTTTHPRDTGFLGVAPDAGLVSVKVGDNTGAVDVSQVIAAIDWVVEHRDSDGRNIRVLNLSYGTDSTQQTTSDPLAAAVENAWAHGIVVVTASGNDGWRRPQAGMTSPATDPYVIAVSAAEATRTGMTVPQWASGGDWTSIDDDGNLVQHVHDDFTGRHPDVVAPGAHIESLRVPGSRIDVEHPEGRVSDTLFLGSGTSQAAAVVSGAAALLLDARPELTPDQVKALLRDTAEPFGHHPEAQQGQGMVDVTAAAISPAPTTTMQAHARSDGLGSLEAARGNQHVTLGGELLSGERTAFGDDWDATVWAERSRAATTWSSGFWQGAPPHTATWDGETWTGASWTGASWTGASWTGASWTGASWTGVSWTGASWTGASWT